MNSDEKAELICMAIQTTAEKLWGDNWLASLVRSYCEIESRETGREIKPVDRRSQITRTLSTHTPTLPVLLRLLAAVGADLQMTTTKIEVTKF